MIVMETNSFDSAVGSYQALSGSSPALLAFSYFCTPVRIPASISINTTPPKAPVALLASNTLARYFNSLGLVIYNFAICRNFNNYIDVEDLCLNQISKA